MLADFRKVNQLVQHPISAAQKTRNEAQKTAQQFEDIMVRTFVSAMRKTTSIGDDAGGMFGTEPGADTYADWFDEKFAHAISSSGKVGVADVLMQEFERRKQIPRDPTMAATPKPPHVPRHLLEIDQQALRAQHLPPAWKGGLDVAA